MCIRDRVEGDTFYAYAMPETVRLTTLGQKQVGEGVNLERALLPTDRLGGHLVAGHIDGTGTVTSLEEGERWRELQISAPPSLMPQIARKLSLIHICATVPGRASLRMSFHPRPQVLPSPNKILSCPVTVFIC